VRLGHLAEGVKTARRGQATFAVMVGSDHNVHLVIEFDKERFEIPLTPPEAQTLAAHLMGGAQQVSGLDRIAGKPK